MGWTIASPDESDRIHDTNLTLKVGFTDESDRINDTSLILKVRFTRIYCPNRTWGPTPCPFIPQFFVKWASTGTGLKTVKT